ncbi:zinc ribbon domain-containing protein [uncultured Adlercreutzia sp.]|uniref:zinc-ribbon domain-containing protein n=1 Tax=uncultured Adlercreutzia sp. TaxID=875803 RepID=UPI0025A51028|nr:zinc ribbon domain-containing protein [uncultured Adlercreutzia sp.]
MFCKQCGTQLPDGSRFCAACGEDLGVTSAQPAASASAGSVTVATMGAPEKKGSAAKTIVIVAAILVAIALVFTQFHVCDYCGAPFFGKSYRAYGYDFLCTDCGSRNAPFVVENDFLTI